MKTRKALMLVLVNTLVTTVLIAAYGLWLDPHQPRLAVLDVGELYRLKEAQVRAVLLKIDATEEERAMALKRASTFGPEVAQLIESLPAECRCVILGRGALVGSDTNLADLTPDARRRLGL